MIRHKSGAKNVIVRVIDAVIERLRAGRELSAGRDAAAAGAGTRD
jgi:hypothetical protein